MRIIYGDYIMESDTFGGFILKKAVVRNKLAIQHDRSSATGETYDDESILGYNMSLEYCIEKILHAEACELDREFTLREALMELRRMRKELQESIKY